MANGCGLQEAKLPLVPPPRPRRRLTWIYSLGHCMVKGNFDQKPIEMQMSTMQVGVRWYGLNDQRRSGFSRQKAV